VKTKHQILLDRIIFSPLAWVMNIFVRIAGKLLFINHDLQRPFKRIAICKFKGMGSIIQASPMISVLKNKFPDSEIIFVSTESNRGILQIIKSIDTIVTVNDNSFLKLLFSVSKALIFLIRKRPQVYIDLEIYSSFSTIFTTLTLSTNRIGFYLRSSSFRMGIYTHMMFFNPRIPIRDVYLQIAHLFDRDQRTPGLYPLYEGLPRPGDFQPGKYIVVNVNASDLRIERRWDKQCYVQLIEQFSRQHPETDILLVGSRGEYEYTNSIASNFESNPRVHNLAGKTSLQELISIIRHSRCLLTNDTGPMHIAFASKTPTVCLFGPCSPEQYGLADTAKVIYKKVYCSPCVHDFETPPCKGNNVCMKLIEVHEVLAAVNELFQSDNLLKQEQNQFIYNYNGEVLGLVKRS
jgi:ADP-heptose:LPS heptosyltransferase